ncbi:hypothetical protein SeMB42_g01730 [Synchytrium endobioticum]|uniref:Uncharacterized protein n=1 Tax=Synchytrium endobioticum TaxID=286115 RepID=A0A507DDZ2_9FUNG|nr:hypothetical protein SeLEV6574_g01674 [Synchytrium endobioticum]TPX51962.1 hypothetical protein SeMB42_g01730 [Synchytrium endobioticum]
MYMKAVFILLLGSLASCIYVPNQLRPPPSPLNQAPRIDKSVALFKRDGVSPQTLAGADTNTQPQQQAFSNLPMNLYDTKSLEFVPWKGPEVDSIRKDFRSDFQMKPKRLPKKVVDLARLGAKNNLQKIKSASGNKVHITELDHEGDNIKDGLEGPHEIKDSVSGKRTTRGSLNSISGEGPNSRTTIDTKNRLVTESPI